MGVIITRDYKKDKRLLTVCRAFGAAEGGGGGVDLEPALCATRRTKPVIIAF